MRDAPYPRDYPQDYICLTALTGYELGREPFPGRGSSPARRESPQKRERVPQDMFDPILRRFARSFPARRRCATTASSSRSPKRRTACAREVRDTTTGKTETIEADYMVGTDGGASTVREQLGIGMSGTPALTYTTNVMFRCPDFSELHDKGKGYRFIFIGPEGTWLTIVAVNGGDRFRMSIVGTPQKINHTEDDIRAALKRAMGRDFDYEILSVMRWVRRELVADRYGTDRIFIAGDAAHLMSPTGGFGMNTGIGDAVDLGWKLDAVIKGWGGAESAALLRRRAAAGRACATSRRRAAIFAACCRPASACPARRSSQPGAANDAARKEYGDWFAAIMRHEWFANGVMLGYRYDDSPIVWPDGTPRAARPVASLHPDRAARRPRAACLARRRPLDARPVRPRLCAAAARPEPARGRADRARGGAARRAADLRSSSTSRRCLPPTSAAWCWCGPTAMSPGAPTPSLPTPTR